jgi:hypothetical protein
MVGSHVLNVKEKYRSTSPIETRSTDFICVWKRRNIYAQLYKGKL